MVVLQGRLNVIAQESVKPVKPCVQFRATVFLPLQIDVLMDLVYPVPALLALVVVLLPPRLVVQTNPAKLPNKHALHGTIAIPSTTFVAPTDRVLQMRIVARLQLCAPNRLQLCVPMVLARCHKHNVPHCIAQLANLTVKQPSVVKLLAPPLQLNVLCQTQFFVKITINA